MRRNDAIRLIQQYGQTFVFTEKTLPKNIGLGTPKEERERRARRLENLNDFRSAISTIGHTGVPETSKPCPGCGAHNRRDEDKICHECRMKIEQYDNLVKAKDRPADREYMLPTVEYGWPYIHWGGQLFLDRDDHTEPNKGFRYWLWRVASLLGRPTIPSWQRPSGKNADTLPHLPAAYHKAKISGGDPSFYDNKNIRLLSAEEVQAIDMLDLCARKMLTAVYAQGVDDGQNLLRQLASGDMTVKDFNKEALRRKS